MMKYLTNDCSNHCFMVGAGWRTLIDKTSLDMMKVEYSKIGIYLNYNCELAKDKLQIVSNKKVDNKLSCMC